jgi:hypothetical protein
MPVTGEAVDNASGWREWPAKSAAECWRVFFARGVAGFLNVVLEVFHVPVVLVSAFGARMTGWRPA